MYQVMFYVGFILALLFLTISIVLFFKNHVARLIGDMTGWSARKAIKYLGERDKNNKTVLLQSVLISETLSEEYDKFEDNLTELCVNDVFEMEEEMIVCAVVDH